MPVTVFAPATGSSHRPDIQGADDEIVLVAEDNSTTENVVITPKQGVRASPPPPPSPDTPEPEKATTRRADTPETEKATPAAAAARMPSEPRRCFAALRASGCSINNLTKPRTPRQKAKAFLRWRAKRESE